MTFGKMLALRIYDSISLLIALSIGCLAFPGAAFAYVDPSVMTYTIQALAGVAVALSAVIGVAFRRSRKVIMRLFHIDENAHKQADPAVHRVDPAIEGGVASLSQADAEARRDRGLLASAGEPRPLLWPQRFVRALVVSVFAGGTLLIAAPMEVVAANSSDFTFGLGALGAPIVIAGLLVCVAVALVISCARGRAFDCLCALVVALGLCFYAQSLFMNEALPTMDGSSVDWGNYKTITVMSSLVWVAVIAGAFALARKRVALCRTAVIVVSAVLIVVQGVGVASLPIENDGQLEGEPLRITQEGLFELSPESNVIVFILDALDLGEMDAIVEKDPAILDELTGFTYFADSAGAMVPTRFALPYLLTGVLPEEGEGFQEYCDTVYEQGSFLSDITNQNYSVGLYTESIDSVYSSNGTPAIADDTINIHPVKQGQVDIAGALASLWCCGLYRDMPWLLKPPFRIYTDDINNAMVASAGEGDFASVPYLTNDPAYYKALTENRLSATEQGTSGAFRFIHLRGSHPPFSMDENAQAVAEAGTSSYERQTRGCFKIVDEYVRQMKELGVYDEATIIITADHGYWVSDEATAPIFLVKPSETAEEAAQPCKVSMVPTGHIDYHATIIDAIGGDASRYGIPVFEVADAPRTRYYITTLEDGIRDVELVEYAIDGYVNDFSNWSRTGRVWEIPPSSYYR